MTDSDSTMHGADGLLWLARYHKGHKASLRQCPPCRSGTLGARSLPNRTNIENSERWHTKALMTSQRDRDGNQVATRLADMSAWDSVPILHTEVLRGVGTVRECNKKQLIPNGTIARISMMNEKRALGDFLRSSRTTA